jgi:hypothetical protein
VVELSGELTTGVVEIELEVSMDVVGAAVCTVSPVLITEDRVTEETVMVVAAMLVVA